MNPTTLKAVKKDPIRWARRASIALLRRVVKEAADAYYNLGTNILTDDEFDAISGVLKERGSKPDVGAPVKGRGKVELPVWMGSLNKKKTQKELDSWAARQGDPKGAHVVADKLDGVSFLYANTTGKPRMYTRGNGRVGLDITPLIDIIGLPGITKGVIVRGELIMANRRFDDLWASSAANPRNWVAGLVNRKDLHTALRDVSAVMYELIRPAGKKPSEQLKTLKGLGFDVAPWKRVVPMPGAATLTKMLSSRKRNSRFELDGLVVTPDKPYKRASSGNPSYSVAFKANVAEDAKETTVLGVDWNVSRTGLLKPVVRVEPIKLKGVVVGKATGHNAKFVYDEGIGKGAKVLVIRSGDVIPYIEQVTKKARKPDMPRQEWRWQGVDAAPVGGGGLDMEMRKAEFFFSTMGVEGFKARSIQKMFAEYGLKNLRGLLELREEDFTAVLGRARGGNVNNAIDDLYGRKWPVPLLMKASSVFPGLGTELLGRLGEIDGLMRKSRRALESEAGSIEGFGPKSIMAFLNNLNTFKAWLEDVGLEYEETGPKTPVSGSMSDEVVLFTGFRDKNLAAMVEAQGGRMASGMSGKVTLVVAPVGFESAKTERARATGVPVISPEDLTARLR